MGLNHGEEPQLTTSKSSMIDYFKELRLTGGALVPLMNHGIPCMSMGFLLSRKEGSGEDDAAIVWRGLMVQKATQQLLFDVDWRDSGGSELDALVIDMPPGTGDVPLTLGQLVNVDGGQLCSGFAHCSLLIARQEQSWYQHPKTWRWLMFKGVSPCSARSRFQ